MHGDGGWTGKKRIRDSLVFQHGFHEGLEHRFLYPFKKTTEIFPELFFGGAGGGINAPRVNRFIDLGDILHDELYFLLVELRRSLHLDRITFQQPRQRVHRHVPYAAIPGSLGSPKGHREVGFTRLGPPFVDSLEQEYAVERLIG